MRKFSLEGERVYLLRDDVESRSGEVSSGPKKVLWRNEVGVASNSWMLAIVTQYDEHFTWEDV
jgi:hypothetical protein